MYAELNTLFEKLDRLIVAVEKIADKESPNITVTLPKYEEDKRDRDITIVKPETLELNNSNEQVMELAEEEKAVKSKKKKADTN